MKRITRPDLVKRFTALGISAPKFEVENALPRNMIAMMRQGKYSTPKADHTIRNLEVALDKAESGRAASATTKASKATSKATKGEAEKPEPAEAPAPKNPPGRPRAVTQLTEDETKRRAELRDRILAAKDIAAVDECNKQVAAALLDGFITDTSARVLRELLAERRQSLEDKSEEEERARAGESVTIEVRYVNAEWRNGQS